MAVSIEAYLLTNFGMDFLSAAIIARSLGRVRWRRVTLSAALGALYAALCQLPTLRFLGSGLILPLVSITLAAVAIPRTLSARPYQQAWPCWAAACFSAAYNSWPCACSPGWERHFCWARYWEQARCSQLRTCASGGW